MTKSTKKQLVLQVATAMCKLNNKLSTKELKIELRNQFPDEKWNKYDNGQGVSDLFHELVNEGKFVSIADNGTYQTYALKALPIKDRKGAAYIPDLEETGVNFGGGLVNVNHGPLSGNLATALANASAKRPVGRPRKNVLGNSVTVKASPATIVSVTKNRVGRPKKQLQTVGLPASAPKLTRTQALKLMENNKGRFFTAIFTKKDGTTRTMNCRYLKDQSLSQLGYVKVVDEALRKSNPNDCTRNINLQTLQVLAIGGTQYKIK